MNPDVIKLAVKIGRFMWFPVKQIGNKYFMVAVKPLFKGYYSTELCDFPQTQLNKFLNNQFVSLLAQDGIEVNYISGMSILTAGQYNMYVKDKLPACADFLIQSPISDKHTVSAIKSDGTKIEVDIAQQSNIRPCFFIDAEYIELLCEKQIQTTESLYQTV